jgi:hypothetical protein
MGTTNANTLCEYLSKSLGDYITFDTTTNIGAAKLVVSTTLNQYDHASDDYFNNWFVYMIEGNNAGVERQISDYATSTGTITVYGANLTAESGAVTCELRRYSRDKCLKAINEATKETFPSLGRFVEDISLISGNWLPNGHFEQWASTSYPDYYELTNVTATETTTDGLHWAGASSAKLTASAGNGYMYIDSDTYPKLLDLMNKSITFKSWAYPEVADDATITIYTLQADGTAQTLTSTTTCPATKWSLLILKEQMLNDNLVYIRFQWNVKTNAKYVYYDNSRVIGDQLDQYFLPSDAHNSDILGVYIQEDTYSNDTLDPCDNLQPDRWAKVFNWQYCYNGQSSWLDIPDLTSLRLIRITFFSPLEQLSSAADTITLDGRRVNLLLAYARYKLFQQEKGLPSSQDIARLDKMENEAIAEYNKLLPANAVPKPLETIRVRS